MTKTIEISDNVYHRLKREKGDRNFSEVIETALDRRGQVADVTGQGIFDAETGERVAKDTEWRSRRTFDRLVENDETEKG